MPAVDKVLSLLPQKSYERVTTREDDSGYVPLEEESRPDDVTPPSRPPPITSAGQLATSRISAQPPSSLPPSSGHVSAMRAEQSASQSVKPPPRPPPSSNHVQAMRAEASSSAQPSISSQPQSPPRPERSLHLTTSAAKGNVWHAHVGASVDREILADVLGKLIAEARIHFHKQDFEQALHVFRHGLSIAEKTASKGTLSEYGALLHNIASCLHCLGDFESAKEHYLAALNAFQKHPPSRVWAALYGDVDKRRCDYVRERLIDIEFGRKPDLGKYLDGFGRKRDVTEEVIRADEITTNPKLKAERDAQLAAASYGAGWGLPTGPVDGMGSYGSRAVSAK